MKLPKDGIPIFYAIGVALVPAFVMSLFKILLPQSGGAGALVVAAILMIASLLGVFFLHKIIGLSASRVGSADYGDEGAGGHVMGYFPDGIIPWRVFFIIFPVTTIGAGVFFGLIDSNRVLALFLMWPAMLATYIGMRRIIRAS